MKLSGVYILIFLLSASFITSCYKKCPCSAASMPIQLVSFSHSESDTIIIRRFTKGANFQMIKDTLLIDSTNCNYINMGGDTLQLVTSSLIGHIADDFDYEVYIPSLNMEWKISGLTEHLQEGPCGRCLNYFTSFVKDGQLINATQLYITK